MHLLHVVHDLDNSRQLSHANLGCEQNPSHHGVAKESKVPETSQYQVKPPFWGLTVSHLRRSSELNAPMVTTHGLLKPSLRKGFGSYLSPCLWEPEGGNVLPRLYQTQII